MEPEHVAARSIFVNKNQSTIVIPACHKCNNAKSAGESDLRDWLIITVGVGGHPDIRRLMLDMKDAYDKGLSKIGHAAAHERRLKTQTRKSGIYEPVFEVPFYDPLPMDRTLRFMARGLYWFGYKQPYLPTQPLSLTIVPIEDFDVTMALFQQYIPFQWQQPLGQNVFNWTAFEREDADGVIPILMTFFGKVAVVAWLGIPERDDERQLSFWQMIRRKGRREQRLRAIVDRRLVGLPPEDLLGWLRQYEDQRRLPRGG